ncbi:MAG: AAA family ATPase [Armatimonadetes bacterium]|nr:AAA family ATPase [Armatimonadota bacterium]
MILRRVTVENYRCFRSPVTVGEFGDGLNMVFGPNETGKSTLVEAVVRTLFDRHKTSGALLKQVQPWGTSGLVPRVLVEFEARGEHYQLEKRFVVEPMAELRVRRNGAWIPARSGDEANDYVSELLHGERSERGPSTARAVGDSPCAVGSLQPGPGIRYAKR